MGEVIPFKKPKLSELHKGKTLCRHGHHAFQVEKGSQFDVKKGALVTVYRCKRCGKQKNKMI